MTVASMFLRNHWQLLLLVTAVFFLWRQPVALPLRLLVVLFHEAAHGIAAVATGGSIVSLTVDAHEGGLATFRGGNFFITASAGYLGSLLIGLGLLAASVRGGADRLVLGGLGVFLIALAVLYMRELFALAFTLSAGTLFIAVARLLPAIWSDVVLRVIGLTSLFYVPYDIFSDTLARSHLRSDARLIAEHVGGTTMMWGALWILISLLITYHALRLIASSDTRLFGGKTAQ